MSIELLLLLAIFVILPLIEQLLRVLRHRNGRAPEQPQGRPAHPPRQARREPRMAPHAPQPKATLRRVPDPITESERAPAREAAKVIAPTPPARRSARRHRAIRSLRNPLGLRRAIEIMTVLGPCRAIDANDWPDGGGRR